MIDCELALIAKALWEILSSYTLFPAIRIEKS